jgi:hypothetical protein
MLFRLIILDWIVKYRANKVEQFLQSNISPALILFEYYFKKQFKLYDICVKYRMGWQIYIYSMSRKILIFLKFSIKVTFLHKNLRVSIYFLNQNVFKIFSISSKRVTMLLYNNITHTILYLINIWYKHHNQVYRIKTVQQIH